MTIEKTANLTGNKNSKKASIIIELNLVTPILPANSSESEIISYLDLANSTLSLSTMYFTAAI